MEVHHHSSPAPGGAHSPTKTLDPSFLGIFDVVTGFVFQFLA